MDKIDFGTDIIIKNKLKMLGLEIDITSGHIFYSSNFQPLTLNFDLVYIRHGETYGNCGQVLDNGKLDNIAIQANVKDHHKRIFQGCMDSEINQLTAFGKKQAVELASQLKTDLLAQNWIPDSILISPLTRAKNTALPFLVENAYEAKCIIYPGIREMSFGAWENRRICDMEENNECHLFYREQNVLVKHSGENLHQVYLTAENFAEVLLRAQSVLTQLNNDFPKKKIIMFSHSMFGAACHILLGYGVCAEPDKHLIFDGYGKNGEHLIVPNAAPAFM